MKNIRKIATEIIEKVCSQNLLDDYMRDKITLDQLIKKAGGKEKVAQKRELEMFLRNKFMIDVKAEEVGVDKEKVIKKVKALLKLY